MDGVLYNSMPNHAIAWQKSMKEFGIHMTAADAYATEGARGIDTIREMVRRQQGHDISLEEAQRMYDVKTRCFHELPETQIFDGVLDLMAKIHAMGMSVNVVTGSGQKPLIERLLLDFVLMVAPADQRLRRDPWQAQSRSLSGRFAQGWQSAAVGGYCRRERTPRCSCRCGCRVFHDSCQ